MLNTGTSGSASITFRLFADLGIRGEDGVGTWTVTIMDGIENEVSGTLVDWRITLWGEAIDAEKAELLPLPGSSEDDDSETTTPTSTAEVKTTNLPTTTSSDTTRVTENPTDHATRPVNSKPNDAPTQTAPGLSN